MKQSFPNQMNQTSIPPFCPFQKKKKKKKKKMTSTISIHVIMANHSIYPGDSILYELCRQ